MYLNSLRAPAGAKARKQRVGRGIGSGLGKTCGKGHKGQKSRSGGFHKVNFEGGQMPLHMRLPKFGFTSRKSRIRSEVRLSELNQLQEEVVTLEVLKSANIVGKLIKLVKVIHSGEITRPIVLEGIPVTPGAKVAIEAAGGSVK